MTRKCRMCGKKFKTSTHNKYYCSTECKTENPRYKKLLEPETPPKKVMSITEINQKALDMGMTYGEYVARFGG